MKDFTDYLKQCKETSEEFLGSMGFMNYNKASLFEMEQFINDMFPNESRPEYPSTIIPFGYYLGETLIRNFPNTKWMPEAVDNFDIGIKITLEGNDSIQAKPFIRVLKFFHDRTDSMVALYEMVENQIAGTLNMEVGPDWKRQGNLMYRVKEVKHDNKI